MYYCLSRYYDPEICRFISRDSVNNIDYESIGGLNLYTYCGNNPISKYDPSGCFAISSVIGIIFVVIGIGIVAATVHDIYQISNLKVNVSGSDVEIENSKNLITPWVQYGYSIYLNYFNPSTKDIIKGTSVGMQFEWGAHNIAYAFFSTIGNENKADKAGSVNLGKTIFSDNTHDGASTLMKIAYILFGGSIYVIWDLIANGGF